KISLGKIHQQFELKRTSDAPWELRFDGKPVDLQSTVALYREPGETVIAFEAVNLSDSRHSSHSSTAPVKLENPLSPIDPNPRLRPSPLPSKPATTQPGNENLDVTMSLTPGDTAYHPCPPTGTLPDRLAANPSPNTPPLHTLAPPQHLQAWPAPHHGSAPPALQTPLIKVELGEFPAYRAASLDQYRADFPGETQEQIDRRLWASWLAMRERDRSSLALSTSNTIKAEASPFPDLASHSASAASRTIHSANPATGFDEQGQNHFQLSALLKDATPEILEASVEASVKLLDKLKTPLSEKMANSPDAVHWIQQIDQLKKQAVKTKTVIGVVGNTGAGKSSVINAMLDEERLVPTNCMRACTAVVTEISYNFEEQPYCAEIEFITSQDWEKELNVLFQDLLDGDGQVSRDCANEDTDAGVAYAKIKAVYPQKTKNDIAKSDIQSLLKEVSHILGSSRNIKEQDSLIFYKKLQGYVDSKEKATGKEDKDGKKEKKEREFWPLIRVVRLYVKSFALETGAVIVDLPGVHDANAARAAVAEGYMKQCTGLWIVAPINRAVDDKAAKSLLGESFKRQLKMDGGFSAVTFICSKTDDISISEAQDSLGLDEKMVPSWEELDRLSAQQKAMEKQLKELKDTKDVYEDVANDVDEQIEVWETLQESVNDGNVAYPPKAKAAGKKRKASNTERPSKKKKRKTSSDDDDNDFIDDDTDEDEPHDSEEDASNDDSQTQEPLTEARVAEKLLELKTTKKDARTKKRELTEQMQEIRTQLKEAKAAESKITSEMSAMCIAGRNQYSKGAIQQDFAAGIKEIDQEIAAEEDEENFNPDTEVRDYDEVARSLPVFCVSSRGYQKLQGRFRKDPPVPGFTNIEETEIPALQAHCGKLTETGRAANCRAFINKLSSLLNSLTIWASSDGTGANLTKEQKDREARFLQKGMEGLETRLEKASKACAQELNDELQDNIFDKYETAIQNATGDSIFTAAGWGAPVDRGNRAAGGLYWATYKAICRRSGVFTNAQGPHDWNAQLTEPMIKMIAPGWEKVFTRRVQAVMNNFSKTAQAILRQFHSNIEDRARKIGTGLASLSMLSQQIRIYDQILNDFAAATKHMIITRQKDINREFVPVIEHIMQPSYGWCSAEVGPGQFMRMKAYMSNHVEQERHTMFQKSADEVKRQLAALVYDVGEQLADKADEVFIQIKRDYRSVFGGGQVSQGDVLPRIQRMVRRDIKRTIDGVERMMRKVVGLEVDGSSDFDDQADGYKCDDDDDDIKTSKSEADEDSKTGIKAEGNDTQSWTLREPADLFQAEPRDTVVIAPRGTRRDEDRAIPEQVFRAVGNQADPDSAADDEDDSEDQEEEDEEEDEDEDEDEDVESEEDEDEDDNEDE
ncbi:MAG: hypothetical protein Q9196_005847, partial [Gyalolechia fulgens]